jgi:hypothetical protein
MGGDRSFRGDTHTFRYTTMPDDTETKELQPLLLKDLVRQVRKELLEIVEENKKTGTKGIFVVEGVTLEVNVTAEREQSLDGKAGARLFVVDLSSKAKKSDKTGHVHKVILQLSARSPETQEGAPGAVGEDLGLGGFVLERFGKKDKGKTILSVPVNRSYLRKIELGTHIGLIRSDVFGKKGLGRT